MTPLAGSRSDLFVDVEFTIPIIHRKDAMVQQCTHHYHCAYVMCSDMGHFIPSTSPKESWVTMAPRI